MPPDRIVAAALELVDEQGADALSMRSLAQRLGSGTATLYRHFASRDEVVAMVVDRMLGEVDLDATAVAVLPWQQACTSFAERMFDALSRHGNVAPLLVGHVPVGPNATALRELMLSVLLDHDFPPATAARVYATLTRYVLGFAIQRTCERHDSEVASVFRGLDPAGFPATAAVAGDLPVPLEEEFAFGLRLIVTGLERGSSGMGS
ncbi:TetR/AcrR family transcriptional regulator [Mycobacterium bourgelatii]|uniref:Putative transcriptional regulator, TetR family protein n=2 Tax=Mycobacterium bourgelatii TaxID=1273442 RepID=A0A7I9YYV5_MYCBU|nr:TetR/AcrR family transcriptional regulator [Mycobacterium bourgelatii]MCV6976466.1 TetR/AcrR family transcriptional regulator [Mycobacterium bourgelatii]GFG93914.1 putative transcriptional regulator, TetR family protein [Mycobacterium bourgelatii]